jgi:hypothetical protein
VEAFGRKTMVKECPEKQHGTGTKTDMKTSGTK